MTNFLLKKFVKSSDYSDLYVREKVGILAGIIGIVTNLLLFGAKFITGSVFGLVSVTADAFNNLSDCGSSVIALVVARLSGKSPDKEHPFGHQRVEYIASLCISFIIIFLGGGLFYTSIQKILYPEKTAFHVAVVAVLVVSALVKLWLYFSAKLLSNKISSPVLKAASIDSLSDAAATFAVLLSVTLGPLFGVELDGIAGAIVAVLIIKEGVSIIRDTFNYIIGSPPDKELCDNLLDYILSYEKIERVHDLIIHSYGPNRMFASIHAEMPSEMSLLAAHEIVDAIERSVEREFGIQLLIHIDPLINIDENTKKIIENCKEVTEELFCDLTIHDFRLVEKSEKGQTNGEIYFDIKKPYECKMKPEEIKKAVTEKIELLYPSYKAFITVDEIYSH